eukprot:COSAG02_NODE_9923_length_2074_cov_1.293165_3_plen_79_part_00
MCFYNSLCCVHNGSVNTPCAVFLVVVGVLAAVRMAGSVIAEGTGELQKDLFYTAILLLIGMLWLGGVLEVGIPIALII